MKHPIRSRLMYLGFQGLRALVGILPMGLAQALGRALGSAAFALLAGQRRLTLEHLRYAYGDTMSAADQGRIARHTFRNFGQTAMEWLILPRLSLQDIQRLVTCEGAEHVRAVLAQGNGAILATAHFGNWEFISLYLRSLGFEGGVLARRLRHPEYEAFLIHLRGSRGVRTIARDSIREVVKTLRANHIVGVLPDQDIDSLEGVFVQFFGRPTYTPIGPAALSLMTGAPILPCFITREGARFRLVIESPLPAPQTQHREEAMAALTQAWTNVAERYIRRNPDQWAWMHRRWKTKPAISHQPSAISASVSAPHDRRWGTAGAFSPVVTCWLMVSCWLLVTPLWGCAKQAHGPQRAAKGASQAADADDTAPTSTDPNATAQQMSTFTLTGYEVDGRKRWELNGQGASIDDGIVTVHHPDAIGYDVARTAYLTASVAQVNQATRHVRLEHDVTIHTTEGLWFTTPVLHWIPDKNEVATDQPVRIETDHMLLRGRETMGFTQLKQMKIFRDIELVLNPSNHDLPLPDGQTKQVTITCDGPLSFDYGNSIATFENNVHVKDPNGDLYSDKLVAYLDQATHTIRYAEASGRVRINQHQNTAESERAVYEPAIGKITLVGKPSLLVFPSSDQGATVSFGGLATSPGTAMALGGSKKHADHASEAALPSSAPSSEPAPQRTTVHP